MCEREWRDRRFHFWSFRHGGSRPHFRPKSLQPFVILAVINPGSINWTIGQIFVTPRTLVALANRSATDFELTLACLCL